MSKNIIAKGALILVAASLVSRLLGYVREKAVFHYFGDNWWTDAFWSAFLFPDLLYYLLAGGALGAALIPILREYLARNDIDGSHKVANSVLNLVFISTVSVGAVAAIFAPAFVRVIAGGYEADSPTFHLTVNLTRLLIPQMVMMALSAVLAATLQCHDDFLWPALGFIFYNLVFIAGAVWLARAIGTVPQEQIYGVIYGILLGAFLMVFMQILRLRRIGFRWRPQIELGHRDVRRFGRAWLPMMLALAFSQISILGLPIILGTYFSEGIVSSMRSAQRLAILPFGLFAASISTAAFPTMSTMALSDKLDELRRTFSRALSSIIYFTLPSAAGLIVLSLPLSRALWQSGEFSEAGTFASAQVLAFFSIGIVALGALQIVNRAFFALKEAKKPLLVSAAAFTLNIFLCIALMQTSLDYRGIALGVSISFIVNAVVLLELLRRRLGGFGGGELLDTSLRCLLATIVMSLAALFVANLIHSQFIPTAAGGLTGFMSGHGSAGVALLEVLAAITVAVPIYLVATLVLKVPDAFRFRNRLLSKLRRPSRTA